MIKKKLYHTKLMKTFNIRVIVQDHVTTFVIILLQKYIKKKILQFLYEILNVIFFSLKENNKFILNFRSEKYS